MLDQKKICVQKFAISGYRAMASIASMIQAIYQYRASLQMVPVDTPARKELIVPQTTPMVIGSNSIAAKVDIMETMRKSHTFARVPGSQLLQSQTSQQ